MPPGACRMPPPSGSSVCPRPFLSFCEHLLQLLSVLGARLDGVGPADLLRLHDVGLARRRVEADGLDACLRLALRLALVVGLPELVLLLVGEGLAVEILALLRRQPLVLV